ncbi:MAG: DUF4959 domain-containing protein [Prevotellaceae bacterium]|jgi:hypothetical protein|nr:DUF4959 domain-containing protein [Prevotellaceae bacterium]
MKQTLYICLLLAAICFAASCDKNEGQGKAPGKVTNISHTPDYGAIVFAWTQPANDENYYYTDIRYVTGGVEHSKKATKFRDSTTVNGLVSDTLTDFLFYSVSKTGARSEPVLYRAAPNTPTFTLVAKSVQIVPDTVGLSGVFVKWENKTGKKATVEVSYINNTGAMAVKTFSASESGEKLISDILTAKAKPFSVTVKDEWQNVSAKRTFTLDVKTASYLDRKGWTVPGYNAGSNNETAGYSSQALNESSTAYPVNGSVMAMFDGEIKTFWHASWSTPSTNYPHWFIVDMGKEYAITHIEMTRRQGNNNSHKGFQVLTCTEAGAANPADPTVWTWQDQGEFVFNPLINDAQRYNLPANPQARYIKVYMDVKFKGSGNYAMISEFGAYALEK